MDICRVCLSGKPNKDLTQLQEIQPENGEKQTYEQIMLFCLGIQVAQNEKTSTKLCEKCYNKIVEFYEFKALALKSDAHLKSIESKPLKNEFLDENIKKEDLTEAEESEQENHYEDEPLVYVKEEYKHEDLSDDEFLSVFKKLKDDFVENPKENEPIKKARGCTKNVKRGRPKKVQIKAATRKICAECGKGVKDLKQHMLQHLPVEFRKTVKCDLCDKLFSSNASRKKHVQRKHLGIKKKCHICGKLVTALKAHVMVVHDADSLPYQCVPCGRRFLSKTMLAQHVSIHTKDRPFECEICSGKYRTKASLLLHKRQVHDKEKSHLCQFCSKSFFKKHHLQVHLRSHTKEKPYECPECNKMFTSSTSLRNHRHLHSDEKKFNCTLCDMSFQAPNYLRAHMLTHIKDKKYPCQYCDVRFHRSDHRRRHQFTAHLRHTTANGTPTPTS